MCTVTCLLHNGLLIITSNRDEHIDRPTAAVPEKIKTKFKTNYFARDLEALGTWFVVDDHKNFAVLLNGGFEKHHRVLPYRESRGIILLDIFNSKDFPNCIHEFNLERIEPFQLITYHQNSLERWVWDGKIIHHFELEISNPSIFSSATLYDEYTRNQRKKWFEAFISDTNNCNDVSIFEFHQSYKSINLEEGMTINRNNILKTVSISQVVINDTNCVYKYYDMMEDNLFQYKIRY